MKNLEDQKEGRKYILAILKANFKADISVG